MSRKTLLSTSLLVLPVLLALGSVAEAGVPYRLGDLRTGDEASQSSYPRGWIEAGDHTFFLAQHRLLGPEVFATGGTPGSTYLLADSSPGAASANPAPYGVDGGRLFWWAWTGEARSGLGLLGALWISDGTPEGTRRVLPSEILIPDRDLNPYNSAFTDGILHFVGCEGAECSLWRSDGTSAGTEPVHSLPGGHPAREIVVAGESVFYTVDDGLWSLDAGGDATLLVDGGDARTPPSSLAAIGSRLFFFLEPHFQGHQLWTSDGTAQGTVQVSSFPTTSRISPWRRVVGSRLYFLVEEDGNQGFEIWRSDGTPQGTQPVTAFDFLHALRIQLRDQDVAIVGEQVFVIAQGDESFTSRSVWVSDGIPSTTRDLLDLTGCQQDCPLLVSPLAAAGSHVVFILAVDDHLELWSSDGTVPGTGLVARLCEASCTSTFVAFSQLGQEVGFLAGDRVWITDGTAGGTRAIDGPGVAPPAAGGSVGRVNDCWLFPGEDQRGIEPWCSEGPPESSHILLDIDRSPPSSDPGEVVAVGDLAVFSARDDSEFLQVFSSDGTPGALRRLTDTQTSRGTDRRGLASGGSFALFDEPGTPQNLWRTDGTDDGTFPIGSLFRTADVAYHGQVYSFGFRNTGNQNGIWKIDGTSAGPQLVVPFSGLGGFASYPTVVGDVIYYRRSEDGELWRTEGTAGTTWKVSTLPERARLEQHLPITELNGLIYFVVDAPGDELWRTDGSPDSAERIMAIGDFQENGAVPGGGLYTHQGAIYLAATTPDSSGGSRTGAIFRFTEAEGLTSLVSSGAHLWPTPFVSTGEDLFFIFDDGIHGIELWRTDGTPAGTMMVADLHRGGFSYPTELTVAGDELFFAATSDREGRELWRVDSTGQVHLVGDLAPGAFSSEPQGLAVVGDTLYFSADDGETGREPWALPLTTSGPPAPPPGPYLTSAAVPGFRFKVRITGAQGASLAGRQEPACIPETLCVSGAVPGRSEVFLRVVGPRANGFLWPTLVKFSTSRVEVWVEQVSSGQVRYYDLAPAAPGFDELPGLFDREGFAASLQSNGAPAPGRILGDTLPTAMPSSGPFTSAALPGVTFRVAITDQQGHEQPVRIESTCIEETVCLSGAIPGRSELFLRIVGPKPNGYLWPTLVRFSTSTIDVWITQTATDIERHYHLDGASPGSTDLSGLFDREGFLP